MNQRYRHKNRIYHFFDDIFNIKSLDPNNIKKMQSNTKIFLFTMLNMFIKNSKYV